MNRHAALLRLGSLPRKRHIAHRREPGFRGEGIAYEEVVTSGRLRPGLQHPLPPAAADAGPQGRAGGHGRLERRRRSRPCGTITSRPARSRRGRPDHGRVPLLVNDDVVWPVAARSSRRRSCTATPPPTRSSSSTAAGDAHTMFGPLPFRPFDYVVIPRCTTYRLEFEPGTTSPTCSSSSRPATWRIPAALPEPRRPAPPGRALQRARPARAARAGRRRSRARTRPS